MNDRESPLAVVTGASSGIGMHLAAECARHGYDVLAAADRPFDRLQDFIGSETHLETLLVDLATRSGVATLCDAVRERPVELLLANAGHGLGHAFFDQDFEQAKHVVDTNISGTIELIHRIGREMRERNRGRILITGSIAGFIPGSFQAVYNGTKAFIDSFSAALRNELKDTNVTVTCLMPGATETDFFVRAGLMDTKIGTEEKADPAKVAALGFKAMMEGEGDVIAGFANKLRAAAARVMPAEVAAEQHRKQTAPGTRE
jgi:short-subunit dehydrogenase